MHYASTSGPLSSLSRHSLHRIGPSPTSRLYLSSFPISSWAQFPPTVQLFFPQPKARRSSPSSPVYVDQEGAPNWRSQRRLAILALERRGIAGRPRKTRNQRSLAARSVARPSARSHISFFFSRGSHASGWYTSLPFDFWKKK